MDIALITSSYTLLHLAASVVATTTHTGVLGNLDGLLGGYHLADGHLVGFLHGVTFVTAHLDLFGGLFHLADGYLIFVIHAFGLHAGAGNGTLLSHHGLQE